MEKVDRLLELHFKYMDKVDRTEKEMEVGKNKLSKLLIAFVGTYIILHPPPRTILIMPRSADHMTLCAVVIMKNELHIESDS